jgi:predicted nucleic acid-binding protein
MNLSVWRTNINGAIVIDTSVVINLHASTQGQRILSCVPHEVVVPQVVADELESETAEVLFLRKLEKDGDISIVQLDDEELEIFEQLVSDARSVDDGEAATIAVAHVRSLVPFIDDRKGRSRATELMGRDPGWSLDLLCHPDVVRDLGEKTHADAVYLSLRDGRMRISQEAVSDVIELIGTKRARECICLPRYGSLFTA